MMGRPVLEGLPRLADQSVKPRHGGTLPLDLCGVRFGKLVPRVFQRDQRGGVRWQCDCDCGAVVSVASKNLLSGGTKSCGCRRHEPIQATHGMHGTSTYNTWASMMQRCSNPRARFYSRYGGRGISVCGRWTSFENFYADMGPRPSTKHSIDRVDNDGNYEPGNCRWATRFEQARNRGNNHRLTLGGETMTMTEWAERTGLNCPTIRRRLKLGWSTEDALTIQLGASVNNAGERNGNAKLTEDAVRAIRASVRAGGTTRGVANAFGVSDTLVWRIARGYAWRGVE